MHRRLVREIMSRPVITIHPDALAVDAAELMEKNDFRLIIEAWREDEAQQ